MMNKGRHGYIVLGLFGKTMKFFSFGANLIGIFRNSNWSIFKRFVKLPKVGSCHFKKFLNIIEVTSWDFYLYHEKWRRGIYYFLLQLIITAKNLAKIFFSNSFSHHTTNKREDNRMKKFERTLRWSLHTIQI